MPVPIDEATAGPTDEQPLPSPHPDNMAAQVAALTRRVDALADSFEATVRLAVAEEVQRVASDLQHTVTALGRILVRDLGKLSQILGEHRDTIVAELRGGSGNQSEREAQAPGAGAPPGGGAATLAGEGTRGSGTVPDQDGGPERLHEAGNAVEAGGAGNETVENGDEKGASSRQWRSRRRKA